MDLQSRDYQNFFDESITKFFSYGALLAQALHTRGVSSLNFLLSIHGRVNCLGCTQGVWDSNVSGQFGHIKYYNFYLPTITQDTLHDVIRSWVAEYS